jgi:hypothetical protein
MSRDSVILFVKRNVQTSHLHCRVGGCRPVSCPTDQEETVRIRRIRLSSAMRWRFPYQITLTASWSDMACGLRGLVVLQYPHLARQRAFLPRLPPSHSPVVPYRLYEPELANVSPNHKFLPKFILRLIHIQICNVTVQPIRSSTTRQIDLAPNRRRKSAMSRLAHRR